MKLSKKLKSKIKKRTLQTLTSVALVTTTLAILKLADFSVPLKMNDARVNSVSTVTIADDGAIVCDSIVQGVRDCNLADGNYTFRVIGSTDGGATTESKDYAVELINYAEDVHYSLGEGETAKTISLGDTSTDYKMLVVKYHKNLTIDEGVTITATNVSNLTYKKGMYLCVLGDLVNNGTISMTARGTYNCAGENVYLWKNNNNSYEYVPSEGAKGLSAYRIGTSYVKKGVNGNNGINRATGGGGQGAAITNGNNGSYNSYIGASTGGTSYAGGNASGGMVRCNSAALAASYTQASATAGGNGYAYDAGSNTYYFAGGGAGITGGTSSYCRLGSSNTETKAQNGTGGLLILYANSLENDGTISSNGLNGAGASCYLPGSYRGAVGGGGSGGGSVNVFYNKTKNVGQVIANGGNGGIVTKCTNSNMGNYDGSVTIINLSAELNYEEKEINMNINETFKIDTSKLKLINQNSLQNSNTLNITSIEYEIDNNQIASVSSDGTITAKKEGSTKLKIVEKTNQLETYIYINVINGTKPQLSSGNNFTVSLKENGTVWCFGKNDNGQLGNGNNDNYNTPVQVKDETGNDFLENIKQVATGYSHSVALDKDGNIYTWGLNDNGQLGNGDKANRNIPVKVNGINNIIKVDAYKNTTTAIDKDGKIYIWGENYSILPMRLISSKKIIDVSGDLFLSQEGMVYNISDLENPISGLSRIAKISCGQNHYLALTVNGYVYSWGDNTYGQLSKDTTADITSQIAKNIMDIAAGNNVSLIKTENNELYVSGNNSNGLIGLGTTEKIAEMTKIPLEEIEIISEGEGTHSVISDINGFVYTTGTNTYGELGNGDNTTVTEFTKIGETKIITDSEIIYMDIGEQKDIIFELINTFNLKIDTIDNNKQNFTVDIPDTTKLQLQDYNQVTALYYSVNDVTITHNPTGNTKNITIKIVKKMDDIIQGIRDTDLADGNYELFINGESYNIELYNYMQDMTYKLDEGETAKTVCLGNDVADENMLVIKYHGNLTVEEGVTLTPSVSKKGMYICVLGDLQNAGEITMTAKGANVEKGQNVYLWKNIDNSYEYVPAEGAKGLEAYQPKTTRGGNKGIDGIKRQTGGGGQSGAIINKLKGSAGSYVGASTGGNSYSGGNGTGGLVRCNIGAIAGSYTQASNTAGGNASAYDDNPNSSYFAGGGAGLIGGTSSYNRISATGSETKGEDGTGGLLMLYTNSLENTGKISSEGSQGAGGKFAFSKSYNGAVGGSGSGGGSINIFANSLVNIGDVSAEGGLGGQVTGTRANMGLINGANGGDGSVTINELGSVLNYNQKSLKMTVQEIYQIDTSKLSYTKLNQIQTQDLTLGTLSYESLDDSIATVDENGKITAVKKGKTKIKITDETNKYSTYIIIEIKDEDTIETVTPQIKEGTNHTITLKSNGTVWTYGKNDNGQLGNNTKIASNEPVQVLNEMQKPLKNIVDIGEDENSNIAVDSDGNVYTWGKYTYLEEQTSTEINTVTKDQIVAKKVNGLSDIIKVDTYKNKNYAVTNDGKVYVWGEGYKEPTLIDTGDVAIIEISGELILGENGLAYKISNPTEPIEYINNIINISSYNGTYAFVTLDGHAYTLGTGTNGILGNGKVEDAKYPTYVKTQDGNLENMYNISIKNGQGIATTLDGKAYVWGDNTNSKIAQTGLDAKTNYLTYATQITAVQDKEGNEITLPKIEIAEAGFNKSSLMDESGYVYSVGQNTNNKNNSNTNSSSEFFNNGSGIK